MTLILFCGLVTLIMLTGESVFGRLGLAVSHFMYGTFGLASFVVMALLAYLGEVMTFEKRLYLRMNVVLSGLCLLFSILLLGHSFTCRQMPVGSQTFGQYITSCYQNGQLGADCTVGGIIMGAFVYPIAKWMNMTWCYTLYTLFTLASAYFVFYFSRKNRRGQTLATNGEIDMEEQEEAVAQQNETICEEAIAEQTSTSVAEEEEDDDPYSAKNLGKKILFENDEFAAESYRRNMIFNENSYFNHPKQGETDYSSDYLSHFVDPDADHSQNNAPSYLQGYQDDVANTPINSSATGYVYQDRTSEEYHSYGSYSVKTNDGEANVTADSVDTDDNLMGETSGYTFDDSPSYDSFSTNEIESKNEVEEKVEDKEDLYTLHTQDEKSIEGSREVSEDQSFRNLFSASNSGLGRGVEVDSSRLSRTEGSSRANLFDDETSPREETRSDSFNTMRMDSRDLSRRESHDVSRMDSGETSRAEHDISRRGLMSSRDRSEGLFATVERKEAPVEQPVQQEESKPKHVWQKYNRPNLSLLHDYPEMANIDNNEIENNKAIIVDTLAHFRIQSEIMNVVVGPSITRYDVNILDRADISNVLKHRDALSMGLRNDNVNAYLNYSKGALSIEIPNKSSSIVGIKGLLASSTFINSKPNSLTFAFGKNVEGTVVCPDITKMPHLLVAGSTGSGKSVCLNALIISLLYKYGPEELRFIMVDPKQNEFISYDKLPHLIINEILYDIDKVIKALNWTIAEMERRYALFKDMTEHGKATKDLAEYNAHLPEGEEKLPKIVVILDEFGDLMLQNKREIESRIIKLVQKARACGIHLILATQRPSVDCITGLIKANLPTKIGFRVNSYIDSGTIFDKGGAEKLLGNGDSYYKMPTAPDLVRVQGCFISSEEVQSVTDYVKQNNEAYYEQSVSDFINKVEEPMDEGNNSSEDAGETKIDDTFIEALSYCVTSNQASVSMIQRRFPVGYIKACKIIDWMTNMNYITPSEGSKPRKVLLTKEEFNNIYGESDT